MWKLDLEDYFFKIYDSHKQIAGYFDPDYGRIHSPDAELEQIQQMHKNADKIARGFLTLPMVKFGVFDEKSLQIDDLAGRLDSCVLRVSRWKDFLRDFSHTHAISVSHTDPDMLSISLEMRFENHVRLDRKILAARLEPTLDQLQRLGLL